MQGEIPHEVKDIVSEEDYKYIRECYEDFKRYGHKKDQFKKFEPYPESEIVSSKSENAEKWKELGLLSISKGNVAIILMSGGQGTRLGILYPKGMLKIGLPSGKSIFQLHAEYVLRIQKIASFINKSSSIITFFILTSSSTHSNVRDFFESNKFFGLSKENVIFIQQDDLPCISLNTGKFLKISNNEFCMSPAGNGNIFDVISKKNIISLMEKRNIKYIHVFGVDNILTRIADPTFIGFLIDKKLSCAIKVIEKDNCDDKVGIYCIADSVYQVIEYSELPDDLNRKYDMDTNKLLFNTGSICSHLFTFEALKMAANRSNELKYHIAIKKIPYMDDMGVIIQPTEPNGIKFEKFIFDVFPFYQKCGVYRVEKSEEFAPIKNSNDIGKDSPETALRLLSNYHLKLLKEVCVIKNLKDNILVEISPSVTYAGEGLDSLKGIILDGSEDIYLDLSK